MVNSAINKVRQIVRLKQVMHRWRHSSSSSSSSSRHVTTGHLPLDVGPDRRRFTVPARFVNLPIFISLLNQARDEFGYQPDGVLSLPSCDPDLFQLILEFLERDEDFYGRMGIEEFLNIGPDGYATCKDSASVGCSKDGLKPLLHKS